ncbi:hypothetical protein P872_19765 [Rhodonellum psychrophilum GCM71 = DSM 17998]|uniref:Haloacid dehalogenase n=2 Tax=Rhodonellum TaxID=336827 RepID=U5BMD3_9BACT|nr:MULTISPECIES: cation-translocating P-type ATPase [Rhodonellum]ERM81660.1 hypothetical protein P872_19765 [Rhodonellum psychrophilum GCM71 = DSM 17998]SDZ39217.1 Ca2+-transporting ATPase [Rhodonellum ikkaensis]
MENFSFTGLSDEEVITNRNEFGTNKLTSEQKSPFLEVLKEVIAEPLFIILVLAATLYFLLGEYSEGIIMLVALTLVAGISLFQENKSRNAVETLKKLSSPEAKVLRNGILRSLPAEELVVNDVILIEDGDLVPVDASVLEPHDFSVNESMLTGESLPVTKEASSGKDMVFQGTLVMTGNCIAKVTAIGQETALGKIGRSLQEIEITKTPLQIQIKNFVRSMVGFGAIAFLLVWGINYYLSQSIFDSLLQGLTLAMSILPEEIPVAFSTFMALGAYHLYKKKVITRSPHTVETLGAATVICADKTGTLTENRMQLSAIYQWEGDKTIDFTHNPFSYGEVLEYGVWASEINPFDPMEKSLHQVYGQVCPVDERPDSVMIHEYPLEGKPPVMTHVFRKKSGEVILSVKGSVEGVLNQTSLNGDEKKLILDKAEAFATKGFRVLAVGKSEHDPAHLPKSQFDLDFLFLGLLAFYDPPKPNIGQVLKSFYQAGIKVKMITGDHAQTALAIAKQVGLKNGGAAMTGEEVMKIEFEELSEKVKEINVFSRMFPEAKLKIIEALKANGEIVAMTGDGVNDGPALKSAHIGVAMGMRGSELAKKAAALILMDDDLGHMTDAVALGRRIYENLKKAIQYIISIHIPIILIVAIPLVLFWKYTNIFSPIHVIFLELIMGPTCSIVFENEPIEANSMQKPPRKMSDTFFSWKELSLSVFQGLAITLGCLGIGFYFMDHGHSESMVRTVIYTTLIFSNLFLTLVNRSFYYSIFYTLRYPNRLIPIVLLASLLVLALSITFPPVREVFDFELISMGQVLMALAVAFLSVIWVEILKFWKRKKGSAAEKPLP